MIPLLRTNFQGGIFLSKISLEKYSKITNAFMVAGAKFCGHDIPECPCTVEKAPNALIAYCDIKNEVQYDAFAHFYIDDYKFESIWRYPRRALKKLIRCVGVITPDFSTYQDDPEPLKLYNTYRMRAFGHWLTTLGFRVINNVRWGEEDTFGWCFDGIPHNDIVLIGTVASGLRNHENRKLFETGLTKLLKVLNPHTIIIYGSDNLPCLESVRQKIKIVSFKSERALAFKGGSS